jgi:hypothetical protein
MVIVRQQASEAYRSVNGVVRADPDWVGAGKRMSKLPTAIRSLVVVVIAVLPEDSSKVAL